MDQKQLLIMGCSDKKSPLSGAIPAINRYDGPAYKVLRSYLRDNVWPANLSVAVLSAKYGLIGGLSPIDNYDQKMDRDRAAILRPESAERLKGWLSQHSSVSVSLGKDYLAALPFDDLRRNGVRITCFEGAIGQKLSQIKGFLQGLPNQSRKEPLSELSMPTYFLPDWDDMLDPDFDFRGDSFSSPIRSERSDVHCSRLVAPERMCDGILVSLAQHFSSKGPLKRFGPADSGSLAPVNLRKVYALGPSQLLMGDCGAFSYVSEANPQIEVEHASLLYDLYGFDYGASVDHIPVKAIKRDGEIVKLSRYQRNKRVDITKENAQKFIDVHKAKRRSFIPVGVIQGLSAKGYARQLPEYVEMGYCHIALGGLVPLSDGELTKVVQECAIELGRLRRKPWLHLFGVFRPKLQKLFRSVGVNSFDSATYFRKAWLRSGQNYLGADHQWYAALRVPMTSDGRTRNRLEAAGHSIDNLQKLEWRALQSLLAYDEGHIDLESALAAVVEYDELLARGDGVSSALIEAYRRTLSTMPWKSCGCNVCSTIGINVVIFRGSNRNKRRGAHNTLMLYRAFQESLAGHTSLKGL